MTAYTTLQFTVPTETKVRLANRAMLTISHGGARLTLSDTWDKPEAVGDLIARMFETLASAPDLTDEERKAVRNRMWKALWDVIPTGEPISHPLPPPADATDRELTYWQRVEDEAESIEDRVICFTKVPGGFCVLDKGHDEGCANVRTVVGA